MKKNNYAKIIIIALPIAVLLTFVLLFGTYAAASGQDSFWFDHSSDIHCGPITDDVSLENNQVEVEIDAVKNSEVIETTPVPIPISIELLIDDVKTEYVVGETIDCDGMSVRVVYNNGDVDGVPVDECVFGDVDMNTVGSKTVHVSYKTFTASYEINVDHNVIAVDAHTMYTNANLNLRIGPGTNYEKITTVDVNTAVTVIGEVVDSDWVKVIYNNNEYYCSGNYLSKTKTVFEYESNVDKYAYGSFVVGEAGTSDKVVFEANKYWVTNVPRWLREKYENSGWKIVVSAQPLNQRFGYSVSIAAITAYEEHTIYLDNRTSVIARAMIHELGHFIDWNNGLVSCSREFKEIFEAEKGRYIDPNDIGDRHHTSNATEYFAEVFSNIIILGKNSIGDIPNTYNFVARYIG
jgi:uncharacterized protein YraI